MAQLDGLMRNDLMKGVAIGLGIAVLVPAAVVALAPVLRPVARSAMKAGILAYEKTREAVSAVGEVVDDLVAEVQDGLQASREIDDLAAQVAEAVETADEEKTAA